MAATVSQRIRPLRFCKKNVFSKAEINFLEIGRKHVFTASNRIIIKNAEEKKKVEQIFFIKLKFS